LLGPGFSLTPVLGSQRLGPAHLEREELELLRQACESSWRKVEPAIFGALLQGALGRERQWALGAHYTAEADILKIVLPTIVEPWRERIAACHCTRLIARRSEICLERQIGLTKLYNEVDDGAYRDLRELHEALDEAVAAAYGWPSTAAHDAQESNRLLLELNRAIAAGEIDYRPSADAHHRAGHQKAPNVSGPVWAPTDAPTR